ncbi:MAG: (2Fe-2S)-binding protein, partial [Dermatophilaceae bacterium]
VCRCEEVSFGTLCATAASSGSRSLRGLKLSTRAGLGICQGRTCGRSVEELLDIIVGQGGLRDGVTTDRRPIAAPIRLGEIATQVSVVTNSSESVKGTK